MNVVLISLFFKINKLVVFKLAAAESAELPMFQLPHLTTFQTQSRGCANFSNILSPCVKVNS